MPVPEKEVLYFFIEDYLQSRKKLWNLDEENPATCELKGTAHDKRAICIEIIKQIESIRHIREPIKDISEWTKLIYNLQDMKQTQHKVYEKGILNKSFRNPQQLITLIDNLKIYLLLSIEDEKAFKVETKLLNEKLALAQTSYKENYKGKLYFGLISNYDRQQSLKSIEALQAKIKALDCTNFPYEKCVIPEENRELTDKFIAWIKHSTSEETLSKVKKAQSTM